MKTSKPNTSAQQRRQKTERRTGRDGSAGSKILAAIEEATAILRSEGLESKQLTIRTYNVAPALRNYQPDDVKRVRELLGASQAVFASFLGVNVNTVRSWEQGKRVPQPMACRFLSEIEADPAYWRRRIGQETLGSKAGRRA